jgi:uncharacterized protein
MRVSKLNQVTLSLLLQLGLGVSHAQTPASLPAPAPTASTTTVPPSAARGSLERHLLWTELMPKGWDPAEQVRERFKDKNFAIISDADPRMLEMLKKMRDIWDTAPVNDEMDGVKGRLPGYIVPLEETKQGLKEFLLVPYYGACIHSPPPPANQIVHVTLSKPMKGLASMDTIWVKGTLRVSRSESYMGASGYKIDAVSVERYVRERPTKVP